MRKVPKASSAAAEEQRRWDEEVSIPTRLAALAELEPDGLAILAGPKGTSYRGPSTFHYDSTASFFDVRKYRSECVGHTCPDITR